MTAVTHFESKALDSELSACWRLLRSATQAVTAVTCGELFKRTKP